MPYIGEPFDDSYFQDSEDVRKHLGYSDYPIVEKWLRESIADDIEEQTGLVSGKRILDVGCAYGYMTDELTLRGASVTGIDISDYCIAKAQLLFPALDFRQLDIKSTGLTKNTFDLVVALSVFDCVTNVDFTASLNEMNRIIKPIGKIYLTQTDNHPLYAIRPVEDWQGVSPIFPGRTITATKVSHLPLMTDVRVVVS